jgi:hypothetical protein
MTATEFQSKIAAATHEFNAFVASLNLTSKKNPLAHWGSAAPLVQLVGRNKGTHSNTVTLA